METEKEILYYVDYTEKPMAGIAPNPKIYNFINIRTGEDVIIFVHRLCHAIIAYNKICSICFEDVADIENNYDVLWERNNKDVRPISISCDEIQSENQMVRNLYRKIGLNPNKDYITL